MKKAVKMILWSLIILGALNWGLVGVFKFDLVAYLLGDMSWATRSVYSLVGISAILAMLCCWIFGDCTCNNDDCGC